LFCKGTFSAGGPAIDGNDNFLFHPMTKMVQKKPNSKSN